MPNEPFLRKLLDEDNKNKFIIFKKSGSVMHNTTWALNTKLSSKKKTKEPIPRKLPKRRTDRPYSYDPSGQLRGIAVDNKNKIQYNSAWDTSLT